jgi:hypothetical protein
VLLRTQAGLTKSVQHGIDLVQTHPPGSSDLKPDRGTIAAKVHNEALTNRLGSRDLGAHRSRKVKVCRKRPAFLYVTSRYRSLISGAKPVGCYDHESLFLLIWLHIWLHNDLPGQLPMACGDDPPAFHHILAVRLAALKHVSKLDLVESPVLHTLPDMGRQLEFPFPPRRPFRRHVQAALIFMISLPRHLGQ